MDKTLYKDVYVFAEQREGVIQPVALELLGKAHDLAAALNEKVVAILAGSGIESKAQSLIEAGADKVIVVDEPELKEYLTEQYSQAVSQVINANNPNIVLFGATTIGRDLAPKLAARLCTGLTADCTKLENVKINKGAVDISEAKILVSGGRGVGCKEGFEKLRALADTLDAEVSSSRSMVDAGIMDHDRQVGQTGKTVRPDVYFALGISGAIQHLAGMEESDLIIAVNKDKSAPIFKVADLGIVGDLNKIVPLLTERLRKERAQK